jgi:carboxyl-terminal processing protease
VRVSKYLPWSVATVALLLLAVAVVSCELRAGSDVDVPRGMSEEFKPFFETYSAIKDQHVDKAALDNTALAQGAIRGMLQALDDPYATYLDREDFEVELGRFRGSFEGIGAEVAGREGQTVIVAPFPDSPAERAGIRPGDVILEVDGDSVDGLSVIEVVTRIRGDKGTTVSLLVQHRGETEPVAVDIVRDVIATPTVRHQIIEGDIFYIYISSFGEPTKDELVNAFEQYRASGARGMLIDLRDNPGGYVSSAIDVTSQFLKEGLVFYQVDGQGNRDDYQVVAGGMATDDIITVLVNEFSASASEIFAGAIRDHQRALLVGTKTFGKGSVNLQYPLSDGAGVYFTVAHWYTPDGTLIEGQGITPNVEVQNNPDSDEDLQLERAVEVLRERIQQGDSYGLGGP